jgi:hypothetical protein
MRELPRLREERGSALEHALLGAGVSPVVSPRTRAKTLAALGVAGSAALLASTVAGPLTTLAKLGWAKLLVGLSIVGVAGALPVVSYYYTHRVHSHEAPVVAPRRAHAPLHRAVAAQPVTVSELMAEPARVEQPKVRAVTRPRATHSTEQTLVLELAALDAARSTLTSGDAHSALALLDIYGDRFPHGRLELEAEVLRIDALAKSGQPDLARRRAEAFLRHHPRSVLAARVRSDAQLTGPLTD